MHSTGVVGWLARNFVRADGYVYSVKQIIDTILTRDKMSGMSGESRILEVNMRKMSGSSLENALCSLLSGSYGGSYIYKLRGEFWTSGGNLRRQCTIGGEVRYLKELKSLDMSRLEEDMKAWFEEEPLSTLFGVRDLRGVYIILHRFKENEEEEM